MMISAYSILAAAVILCCDSKDVDNDIDCKCRLLNDDRSSAVEDRETISKSSTLVCPSACHDLAGFTGMDENMKVNKTAKCGKCEFCIRFYRNLTDKTLHNDLSFLREKQRGYPGCHWVENDQISELKTNSNNDGYLVNCTSITDVCKRHAQAICNIFWQTTSETSTQTTKVATLVSPNGSSYTITGPIFLMIGFIVGFAILGVMLVSIFYQARLRPTSQNRSDDSKRSRFTDDTAVQLRPLAKSDGLLLVPRNQGRPMDSVHQTVLTEMPSFEVYKETKN